MSAYSPIILQKKLNWIQSAGINNKKYNPWVGAQLLGVRDQFLIFHPLILLWDLKRIQLFLHRVQSYTNYSLLLVDSRPTIRLAIEHYLANNNIPKTRCQLLNFDSPGTLTNQYYMNTQSNTTSIITPRQIIVFFDYYLNKQFYTESLLLPSVRFSLYSLQNLPTNMQYGLPAKTGLLCAIRLLLKLLLKPFVNLQWDAGNYHNLITRFHETIPYGKRNAKLRLKQKSLNHITTTENVLQGYFRKTEGLSSWKIMAENNMTQTQFGRIKQSLRRKVQTKKKKLFRNYKRFCTKKISPYNHLLSTAKLVTALKYKNLAKIFDRNHKFWSRSQLFSNFSSILFFNKKAGHALKMKKNRILNIHKGHSSTKSWKIKLTRLKKISRQAQTKRVKVGVQQENYKKIPSLSSLNLLHLLTGTPLTKQSKKKLIAKYARTCELKTQKEWQEIKQQNKLQLDKKKALLREKQKKNKRVSVAQITPPQGTSKDSFHSKQTHKAYRNKRTNVTQSALTFKSSQDVSSERFNTFKSARRSFASSRPMKRIVNKRKKFSKVPNWTAILFTSVWYRLQKKYFRAILPTKRVLMVWKRYFSYPFAKFAPKLILNSSHKRGLRLKRPISKICLVKGFIRKTRLYPTKTSFDNMLCSLPAMRKWNQKRKKKLRIRLFSQWARVLKRLSRRRDRRWRQRKWKRAALRQLIKRYQSVYTRRNIQSGFTYWQQWKIEKSKRPVKWRKWRSKYFRRYTRKEQLRLQLLYNPRILFFRRQSPYIVKRFDSIRNLYIHKPAHLPKVLVDLSASHNPRKKSRAAISRDFDGRLSRRFTKSRFMRRRKIWTRFLRLLPRGTMHQRLGFRAKNILKKQFNFSLSHLALSTTNLSILKPNPVEKKNYTNQLWFRVYRNTKLHAGTKQKLLSKDFRQVTGQKKIFLSSNHLLHSYWTSTIKLKNLLKYKHSYLWNGRLFRNRQRTKEELKRYVQNFQHTSIKLHKHKVISLTTAKNFRQKKIQKLLSQYKLILPGVSAGQKLLPFFQVKPTRLSKLRFLNFNGKLKQNGNILVGINQSALSVNSFLQCYSNRRFWANDNFGPSPLVFWISPKARRKKTPIQWKLKTSLLNFRLDIQLPNFSCLATKQHINQKTNTTTLQRGVNNTVYVKELNKYNDVQKTFKFVVQSRERISQKKDRWLWYFLKKNYSSQSIRWQQGLTYTKKTQNVARVQKARKVIYTHYKQPKSVKNNIAYLLRCNRRRRRRLRERTFQGPTRYRRKYRTQYMYNNLIRLNSHRSRYGKPDTRNHVNHYFIRKLVLRRFLRLIYGPKLTNKYFKHFSNLLFIKKFKFWTLYTFFYLRLDFVAILLKFALNLTWSRHLIQAGLVLVNDKPEKASYSIFLGDVIRLDRLAKHNTEKIGLPLDVIRNLAAFAPRVASSLKYQIRLRVPPFFEYSSRIKAGTMFRLPWYYEVRGKLINKENFLLLARGHNSI